MKCLFTLICSMLLCNQALGNTATLLGPDLEPVWVEIRTISPEWIRLDNGPGDAMILKPEQVLRLTLNGSERSTPDAGSAVLTLRDGQVLVGTLVASNDDEAVRIKLDANRAVQVPLDELLSLAIKQNAKTPAVDEDDALLLATGEVLTGFVETFTKDAVGFVVGDADDVIEIPMQRIQALSIANKPRPVEAKPGMLRVTTTEGSVLLVEDATLTPSAPDKPARVLIGASSLPILASRSADEGVSTAASSQLTLPLERVVTIEPVSTKVSLTSLSKVEWDVVDGGEVFGVGMPPRVAPEGAIHLHAPVTLGFDLPKGVRRLAFTAAMDLDKNVPEVRRGMAGCELVVYDGDNAVARHTLTPDGPAKRLNVPLTGDLRIALEAGVNGPVLDRVILTQAELLVSE